MKLVFCGTPDFAVPSLEALVAAGHEIALVLTQPDRPVGRRMELHAPPVKRLAETHGIRVVQPEKLKHNNDLREELEAITPEAIIVVAYGRILPGWMLELPRLGCINVHGSLLPKYRGAAPIQWAVAKGETETGVTTMRLDAGMDTGDMLLAAAVPIGPDTRASELFPQLAELGAEVLLETLAGCSDGTLQPRKQDETQATLAPILNRDDGRVWFSRQSAGEIYNRFRGFHPWPGIWTHFRGKRFIINNMKQIHQVADALSTEPSGALRLDTGRLVAIAATGAVELVSVQMEGKAALSGNDFARGFQLKPGELLA